MNQNEKVNQYAEEKVPEELKGTFSEVRTILMEVTPEWEEKIKWGAPCYVGESNVVGLVALKNYIGLWFYQGALLDDPREQLIQASEKTTALRQLRFSSPKDIDRPYLTSLLEQAAQHDAQGKKVKARKVKRPKTLPIELQQVFHANAGLKKTFEGFSPSQQREYVEYIGGAKRASTRERRAKKAERLLTEGKGLNDKYRGR